MSFDGLFCPAHQKLFKAEAIIGVLHKNTQTFIKYSSEQWRIESVQKCCEIDPSCVWF